PIVCRRIDGRAVPAELDRLNFIFFDDPSRFEASADQLANALQTDIDWIRKHTEFGEAARRWSTSARARGLLLRSPVLEHAERWVAARPRGAPAATQETQVFIPESRTSATRRRNILTGSLAAGLLVALGLAGLAYWQRGIAQEQRQFAEEQRQFAEAQQAIAEQQSILAKSEADRAERNFGAAKNTIHNVVFNLVSGLRDVEGLRVDSARRMLEQAEAAIAQLAARTDNDPEVRTTQGTTFALFADTYTRLGQTELALDYARKALAVRRALAAEKPDDVNWQVD